MLFSYVQANKYINLKVTKSTVKILFQAPSLIYKKSVLCQKLNVPYMLQGVI